MPDKRKLAFSLTVDWYAKEGGTVETELSMKCVEGMMPPKEWLADKLAELADRMGDEDESGEYH